MGGNRPTPAGYEASVLSSSTGSTRPFLLSDLPDTGHSELGKRTFTVRSGAVRAHRIGMRILTAAVPRVL